jgi:hypothetical protein
VELRGEWEEASRAWLPLLRERRLRFDLALSPAEVDEALLASVEALEPFGAGNEEPLFRLGPLRRVGEPRSFGGGHLAFEVEDTGRAAGRLAVVAWSRIGLRAAALDGVFEMLAALEGPLPRPARPAGRPRPVAGGSAIRSDCGARQTQQSP